MEKKTDQTEILRIKLAILGDSGVGKTSILVRSLTGLFINCFDPSPEDEYIKHIKFDDDEFIFHIFETSSSEYDLQEIEAIILVFSLTSKNSFKALDKFRSHFLKIKSNVLAILVGNKCDLVNQREVSAEEIEELAKKWNCPYFETSAVNGSNIESCFYEVLNSSLTENLNRFTNDLNSMNNLQLKGKITLKKNIKKTKLIKQYYALQIEKLNLEAKLKAIPRIPALPVVIVRNGSFISDFSKLLLDQESSDSNLLVHDGSIPVHSTILSVRCPKLLEYLKNQQCLPSNFSVSGIHFLLEYLYTSQISNKCNNEKDIEELLEIAKFFDLKKLIDLCTNPQSNEIQNNCRKEFFENIEALQKVSNVSDINISLDDKSQFSLHKFVLISRSEWFNAAFKFQWKEQKQSTIQISDISSSTFQMLIDYLYTDELKFNNNLDSLTELLLLSDQYQLPRLKELCESELSKYVTPSTLLNLYEYSVAALANQLGSICLHLLSFPEFYEPCHKDKKFSHLVPPLNQDLASRFYSKLKLEEELQSYDTKIKAIREQCNQPSEDDEEK